MFIRHFYYKVVDWVPNINKNMKVSVFFNSLVKTLYHDLNILTLEKY